MGLPIKIAYPSNLSNEDERKHSIARSVNVSTPAIVQSYDAATRTVSVQPAIRARYTDAEKRAQFVQLPLLINVPVVFPSAGDYMVSMPIHQGDECLVVFADRAIDNWWLNGGVQNPIEQRVHDLSDGIAIFGLQNQQTIKSEVELPGSGLHLYHTATGTGIEIGEEGIKLTYYVKDPDTGEKIRTEQRFGVIA